MKFTHCSYPECSRPYYAKGYCKPHYDQQRQGRSLRPLRDPHSPTCNYPECGRRYYANGYCKPHYMQDWKGESLRPVGTRPRKQSVDICLITDCDARTFNLNLCESHYRLFKKYNVSVEELDTLMAQKICGNPRCDNLARDIDHDHDTGKVRGRLCAGCNTALGMVKDDPDRLIGLAEYMGHVA